IRIAGTDSVNPCFGTNIVIDHPNGFSTRYAHLASLYVSSGQTVTRGQIIGQSGNTGCSSGPHLHWGAYITSSWTAIDPYGWSGAAADPWASNAVLPGTAPTFYFSEGYTGTGFTETLTLVMPGQAGNATIDYYTENGHLPTSTIALSAGVAQVINVNAAVGANHMVSAKVSL